MMAHEKIVTFFNISDYKLFGRYFIFYFLPPFIILSFVFYHFYIDFSPLHQKGSISFLFGGAIILFLAITVASWQFAINRCNETELRKMSAAVSQNPASIIITDTDGNIEYVNESFTRITGYIPEEVIGKNPRILKTGIHSKDFYENLWATIKSGGVWQAQFSSKHKHGQVYWKSSSISPIKDRKGKIVKFIAVNQDITELKQLKLQYEESQRMLTSIINTIPIRVFWKDLSGNFLGCNQLFAKDAGEKTPEDIVGKNEMDVKWTFHKRIHQNVDKQVLETGHPKLNYEEALITDEGDIVWFEINKIPLKNESGEVTGILGTYQHITERKNREIHLQTLSKIDPLTGVYNRRYFDEKIKLELDRTKRYNSVLSLIVMDIDHFKSINDTFGHPRGDAVLKTVANIVDNNLRVHDTIARIGGEEFAIISPGISLDEALKLADRLRNTIEDNIFGEVKQVTCSFGVATASAEDDAENFFQKADQALYASKNQGRNRVTCAE